MAEHTTVDRLLHDVMVDASGGLDPELTRQALRDMQEALTRQFAALKKTKYKRHRKNVKVSCPKCDTVSLVKVTLPGSDADQVARAAVATAKAGDTLARLGEFLSGKPDSRPEAMGTDWLRGLTDEQVRVVAGWVEANGARRSG